MNEIEKMLETYSEEELRNVTGTVFNVVHYCIHDGPGIRTDVFIKGCPLRCQWCANPESQERFPQLMYRQDKCVSCGACMAACPSGAVIPNGLEGVRTVRDLCTGCGACVKACKAEAREISGYETTVGEMFDEVAADALFYGNDGGLTVTGGEALAHPKFTAALLKLCRNAGIGTCVETCGFVAWDVMKPILELADYVLYDIKQMDSELHRRYTGQRNELIHENLIKINDELNCEIIVRVPVIPRYNDSLENILAIGEFVSTKIGRCRRVDLLPYHNMGDSKAEQLEKTQKDFSSRVPEEQEMQERKEIIRSFGLICK